MLNIAFQTTEVVGKYAKKHCSTRWLSLKFVFVRLLEQWEDLTEYFLKFFPKEKNFKGTIKETSRCKRIIDVIQTLANITLYFVHFLAKILKNSFSNFIRNNQRFIFCIHQWRNLFCLMLKFAKKYLFQANGSAKSSSELVRLDGYNLNHQKSLRLIEIGTKAKLLFSGNLVRDEKQDQFRKKCQLFNAKVVMYLQQNLPFDVTILKYAQFLHPEKRNNPGSTRGISNLALKVTKALKRTICKTSQVPQTAENKFVTKLELSG